MKFALFSPFIGDLMNCYPCVLKNYYTWDCHGWNTGCYQHYIIESDLCPYEIGFVTNPILQMRKVGLWRNEEPNEDHTAREWPTFETQGLGF